MIWYWIAGIAAISAVALLVYNFIRERDYLKKKTSQAVSEELWEEIQEERADALIRKKKFDKVLEDANKQGRKNS